MKSIERMTDAEKIVSIYLDCQKINGKEVPEFSEMIEAVKKNNETEYKKIKRFLSKFYHPDLMFGDLDIVENNLKVAKKYYPELSQMDAATAIETVYKKIPEVKKLDSAHVEVSRTPKEEYDDTVNIFRNYLEETKRENPTFLSIMEMATGKFNQFIGQNLESTDLLTMEFELIKNEAEGLISLIRNCILYLSLLPDSTEMTQKFKEEAIKLALKKYRIKYDYRHPDLEARNKIISSKKKEILSLIRTYINENDLAALVIDNFNQKEFSDISEEDMIYFADLLDEFAKTVEELPYNKIILKPEIIESIKEDTSKKINIRKLNLLKIKKFREKLTDSLYYPTLNQNVDEEIGKLKKVWGYADIEMDKETFDNMQNSYDKYFRQKVLEFSQAKRNFQKKLDDILKGEKFNNLKLKIFFEYENVTDYVSFEQFIRWLLSYCIQGAKIRVKHDEVDKFNHKLYEGYSEYKDPVLFKLNSISILVNNPFQDVEITPKDILFLQIPVLNLINCVTHLGITDFKAQNMFGVENHFKELTKIYNSMFNIKKKQPKVGDIIPTIDELSDIEVDEDITKKTHL